ncbi:MAG: carboxypeptidase regulatory-like domain-containing protein [Pseudomonadota bacterium]
MKKWSYLGGAAASVLAAVALTPAAYAQQTTSDIRGQVTDADGVPLPGATVTIVDNRTNQARSFTTNSSGRFSTRTIPVGGPYVVTATADGFQGQTNEEVYASISAAASLSFSLTAIDEGDAATLETIVVTGQQTGLQQLAIGPGTAFGLDKLSNLPSIDRDLRDTIRLDPRVIIDETNDDNISCLGGNNRGNTFTVDGVRTGDAFGLNASGFPARNSTPIPFDSIQEVSVEFAPFDVEYGQFTGCNINVVTVQGSNEVHGSGFFVYSNDALIGDSLQGNGLGEQDFDNLNWGAQLTGPIIKDRLFFAVSYEQFEDSDFVQVGPSELGFVSPTTATLGQIEEVQNAIENTFGLETGGIPTNVDEENTRVLARLDWLITDRHRAEFTYNYLDEAFVEPDGGGFGFGAFDGADFIFGNTFETSGTRADSYSLRLFSEWTDNFSTEFRISRNDIRDIQDPVGGGEAVDDTPIPRFVVGVPELDNAGNFVPIITNADGDVINCDVNFDGICFNDDAIVNGPGTFRSANELEQEIDQIKIKADYALGDHLITAGYELDSLDVFNLFVTNATGVFVFQDAAAVTARQSNDFSGFGSFSGDINDAAADFRRNIHSLYLQDKWQVTSDLELLFGLRYDFYDSDDTPTLSQAFLDRYGFENTTGFNSLDALMPRFGFTYESPFDLAGRSTFRGGIGVFAGGDPTVFFSNAFTNFGSGQAFGADFAPGCTPEDFVVQGSGGVIPFPQCAVDAQQASAALGLGRVDAIDPNLELPTVTRFNIGFSHSFDFGGAAGGFFDGWDLSVDYIHTIPENTFDFVDLGLTPIGTASDGRTIFNGVDPLLEGCDAVFIGPRVGFSGPADQLVEGGACDRGTGTAQQDILLTNAVGGDGNSDTFSFQLSKRFDWEFPRLGDGGVDLTFGYAYTDVTNVNPNTSSTATSNFEEVALSEINNPRVAPSALFNEHNVTLAARFEQDFISDLTTAVTFFYNGRSGRRFSYVFDSGGNDFGDSDNEDRALLFIPELGDPNVVFATPEDEMGFNQFIAEQGLEDQRGSILGRNAFQDPFFNDLDIRFEQELPTFLNRLLPDARAVVFADVQNFLNLINDDRNVFNRTQDFFSDVAETRPVIDVAVQDDGTFLLSGFEDEVLDANGNALAPEIEASLWQVQFGIRFEF